MHKSIRLFNSNIIIGGFLVFFAAMAFFPFYYVIIASLSDAKQFINQITLLPVGFTLKSYSLILKSVKFLDCFKVTVLRTVLGVSINLLSQCSFAYSLSKKYLPGRKFFTMYIIIPMLFNGGMIPTYMVVKNTGLIDTIWALVIPIAMSAYQVILFRVFFENIPDSLEESAKIDGANDIFILLRIYIPLSLPIIATIGLFDAVWHWNAFMDAIIYLNSYRLQVLQIFLRDLIIRFEMANVLGDQFRLKDLEASSLTVRAASITVSTLPIVMIYPFLQKHFLKGIMLGAIKG
jgi:putative aldouronate transport system permease protein